MIKLSKASKMPCRSWSLQAIETCPAAKNKDGSLVDACKGCYATTGYYHMKNVVSPRLHNKEDWKRDEWVDDMVDELDNDRYFRWFDSGDMYSLGLAKKILEVMQKTPWTRHWLPTRMHKFAKFHRVIDDMQKLHNVVVRLSSDSVTGETIEGKTTSTIIPNLDFTGTKTMAICKAYERKGKCEKCRLCWDKDTPIVAYVAHGVSMKKVVKNAIQVLTIA